MSSISTPVSERHFDYVRAHTRGEDEFLVELKEAARVAGFPPIWIAPEQGSFLRILLKASGSLRVAEVGTLAGVSAIHLARGLPPASRGGRLDTVERDPERASFARHWIARSDVADRVHVHTAPAAEFLAGLPDQSLDALFLDADKAGYPAYLREGLRIVRPGGLILVDNAFAFGELFTEEPADPETAAVREFNEIVAETPGLDAVIVPLGDGLWVGTVEEPLP